MRSFSFVVLALLLLGVLVGTLVRHYRRAGKAADVSWDDLLKRLSWVDRDKIATVALDVITASGKRREDPNSFSLNHSAIWALVGGLEGLDAMERNSHVLVEIAAYVQRWYPEALVVAEQLRLNAREVEWHIGRLKGAAQTGNLQSTFSDYAQRATATYYLMTRHVLSLYEHANLPELVDLQRAI